MALARSRRRGRGRREHRRARERGRPDNRSGADRSGATPHAGASEHGPHHRPSSRAVGGHRARTVAGHWPRTTAPALARPPRTSGPSRLLLAGRRLVLRPLLRMGGVGPRLGILPAVPRATAAGARLRARLATRPQRDRLLRRADAATRLRPAGNSRRDRPAARPSGSRTQSTASGSVGSSRGSALPRGLRRGRRIEHGGARDVQRRWASLVGALGTASRRVRALPRGVAERPPLRRGALRRARPRPLRPRHAPRSVWRPGARPRDAVPATARRPVGRWRCCASARWRSPRLARPVASRATARSRRCGSRDSSSASR